MNINLRQENFAPGAVHSKFGVVLVFYMAYIRSCSSVAACIGGGCCVLKGRGHLAAPK